jgi:hypothetical protein
MVRFMDDAANLEFIDPNTVDLIAYYVDGNYVPSNAQLARFAGKVHVPISVNPSGNMGTVLDGAPDNGSTGEEPGWVARRRRAGIDPTVYTSLSLWPGLIRAMNSAGVAQPHWWIAEWNNRAEMIDGAIAHQYVNNGNKWDRSVVADYWPGIDPVHNQPPPPKPPSPPAPPPGPTPAQLALLAAQLFEEDDMILVHEPSGGIYLVSGSLYVHVPDISDVTSFEGAGVKQVNISAAFHTALEAGSAALQGKLSGTLAISGQLSAS